MGGGRPCNCTGGRRQLGRRQWWGRRRSCRARVGGRRRAAARPTGGGGLRDECQASRLQKIYSIPQPRSAAPKHSDPGCGVGPRGETAHTHTAHRSTHTHSTRQTHHNSTHTHNTTQHTAHSTQHTHIRLFVTNQVLGLVRSVSAEVRRYTRACSNGSTRTI